MSYKVETEFEHKGYKCVVIMTERGYRCGYVGIPKKNMLHGIDYNEQIDVLKVKDIESEKIGKRSPIMLFGIPT